MLGIQDAEHEESAPQGSQLVISRLSCSLANQTERVTILPGTLAHRAYARPSAAEQYACRYGLNPAYRPAVLAGGLVISGEGAEGEARMVELPAHPFFIATLFLPQLSSSQERPHPLIKAYLEAARALRNPSEDG